MQPLSSTYYVKLPEFNFKPVTLLLFIVSAIVAWIINIFGYSFFPTQNLVPFIARTLITLLTDLALVYISFRLLKRNNLTPKALGLSLSGKTITNILGGAFIGIFAIAILAGLIYAFIPFHFVSGKLGALQVLQESISYLVGNTVEELMFRGFLFIILSQLIGWKKSSLVTALLFGLFHLQGTGLTLDGLKMVATTACYSFVFCFTMILLRSLWAAITVHAVSNILLHAITGLDGANKSLYSPVFEKNWPKGYDAGLILFISCAVIISFVLFFLIQTLDQRHTRQ